MFYKISILPSLVDTVVKEIGIKSETAKLIFGTDGRRYNKDSFDSITQHSCYLNNEFCILTKNKEIIPKYELMIVDKYYEEIHKESEALQKKIDAITALSSKKGDKCAK